MTVLSKKINTIIDEGTQIHLERLEVMRVLWTCLLARKHPFLLGEPGLNKTRIIDWVCRSINGAMFWEVLCNNQLSLEDFFGPIDMAAYDKHGVWHRDPTGYLPQAHVALIDEVFKANGTVLNPLLDIFVRFQVKLNSTPVQVPGLMYAMASNELPTDEKLGAFWDRRGCGLIVKPIRETRNLFALLDLAAGDVKPPAAPTTVDLADVQEAVFNEVPAVVVPRGIKEAIVSLKEDCEHPSDGEPRVSISDRRLFQSVSLIQASAYLAGRDVADDEDLMILRHFLWETPELIPTVDKRVLKLSSPQTAKALEVGLTIDEFAAKLDSLKGQSKEAKNGFSAEFNSKLPKMNQVLTALRQDALTAGRSVTKIDDVRESLRSVRKRVFVECLGMPEKLVDHIPLEDEDTK